MAVPTGSKLEMFKSLLPLMTTVRTIAAMQKLGDKTEKYYELKDWFIAKLIPFMDLRRTDIFADLTAGQALLSIQVAFEGIAGKVFFLERNIERYNKAENNSQFVKSIMEERSIGWSPMECHHGDFTDPAFKDIILDATILLATIPQAMREMSYLKQLIVESRNGTRFFTNQPIIPFKNLKDGNELYQVIKLAQNADKVDNPAFAKVKNFKFPKLRASERRAKAYEYKNADDKVPKANQGLFTTAPNTTRDDTFMIFYITIKRLWTQVQMHDDISDPTTALKWKVDDIGYVPIQLSTRFHTVIMALLQRENGSCRICFASVEGDEESIFFATVWVPESELFKSRQLCDLAVQERNDAIANVAPNDEAGNEEAEPNGDNQPDPLAAPPASDINDLLRDVDVNIDHVLNVILPHVNINLGCEKQDLSYVSDDGVREENGEDYLMNIVHGLAQLEHHLESIDPFFQMPVVLTAKTSKLAGVMFPDETLTDMGFTLKTKDSDKPVPVYETDILNFRVIRKALTIRQFQDFYKTPFNRRTAAATAMIKFVIKRHRDRYLISPPQFLVEYSLTSFCGRLNYLKFTDLSKLVSMISKGSFLKFHFHPDGCLVWETISKGAKLMFFILKPIQSDYDFMETCGLPQNALKFMSNEMKGRVFVRLLRQGETVVFPGHIPHAMLAVEDTLAYGGHFMVFSSIPYPLHYLKSPTQHMCLGSGYSSSEVMMMVVGCLGYIHYTLWTLRAENKPFYTQFEKQISGITQSLATKQHELHLSDDLVERARIMFSAFQHVVSAPCTQTAYGVFIKNEDKDEDCELQRNLRAVRRSGKFVPIVTNVLKGSLPWRNISVPTFGDIDYPNLTDNEVIPPELVFGLQEYTKRFLAGSPLVVLESASNQFGIFAFIRLQQGSIVAEYTGQLLTSQDIMELHGSNFPNGRVYRLQSVEMPDGDLMDVFVDANKYGGVSHFLKISSTPNCKLELGCVAGRLVLFIVSIKTIKWCEELSISPPILRAVVDTLPQTPNALLEEMYAQDDELDDGDERDEIFTEEAAPVEPPQTTANVEQGQATVPKQTSREPTLRESFSPDREIGGGQSEGPEPPATSGQQNSPISVPGSAQDDVEDSPSKSSPGEQNVPPPSSSSSASPNASPPLSSSTVPRPPPPPPTLPTKQPDKRKRKSSSLEMSYAEEESTESSSEEESETEEEEEIIYKRKVAAKESAARKKVGTKVPPRQPSPSASSSSTDTEQERPRTFTIGSRVLKAEWSSDVRNDQNKAYFDKVSRQDQHRLKHKLVAKYYEEFEDYQRINNDLINLYKTESRRHCCAVCAHLNEPINHYPSDPFHKFAKFKTFRRHYARYHFRATVCNICDTDFPDAKHLKDHMESMKFNPNEKHMGNNMARTGLAAPGHAKPSTFPATPGRSQPSTSAAAGPSQRSTSGAAGRSKPSTLPAVGRSQPSTSAAARRAKQQADIEGPAQKSRKTTKERKIREADTSDDEGEQEIGVRTTRSRTKTTTSRPIIISSSDETENSSHDSPPQTRSKTSKGSK